ncbi:hypothetical protein [Streptomyces sp. NPDC002057]|uniref:hypothetical protein n=1 Tax=Streptomyces sp. NPDC002057 TaxID=3154664 RepID=UPI00331A8F20
MAEQTHLIEQPRPPLDARKLASLWKVTSVGYFDLNPASPRDAAGALGLSEGVVFGYTSEIGYEGCGLRWNEAAGLLELDRPVPEWFKCASQVLRKDVHVIEPMVYRSDEEWPGHWSAWMTDRPITWVGARPTVNSGYTLCLDITAETHLVLRRAEFEHCADFTEALQRVYGALQAFLSVPQERRVGKDEAITGLIRLMTAHGCRRLLPANPWLLESWHQHLFDVVQALTSQSKRGRDGDGLGAAGRHAPHRPTGYVAKVGHIMAADGGRRLPAIMLTPQLKPANNEPVLALSAVDGVDYYGKAATHPRNEAK